MKLVIFGANGQTGRLATAVALNAGHRVKDANAAASTTYEPRVC
jgi:uncharacterized protein YbjT (DUF2867 family)